MLSGFQTEEFISRFETYGKDLPLQINLMAEALQIMIREIEKPKPDDIKKLHSTLRQMIKNEESLTDICGTDGRLCQKCPFGAYLPQGVAFASPSFPFCLPWISLESGKQTD